MKQRATLVAEQLEFWTGEHQDKIISKIHVIDDKLREVERKVKEIQLWKREHAHLFKLDFFSDFLDLDHHKLFGDINKTTCAICLSYDRDSNHVSFSGRLFHATCINFWLNSIDTNSPL